MPPKKSSSLQTVLIPKSSFTLVKAKAWLKKHGIPAPKVDSATNFYRFRQASPSAKADYYTVKLPNGVELVYMK